MAKTTIAEASASDCCEADVGVKDGLYTCLKCYKPCIPKEEVK